VLGEDALDCGLSEGDLAKLDALVVTAILPDRTTANATVLLPASSWAEKRGSMINIKGRLQRLNKAISSPGKAREDWEILGDLIQAVDGTERINSIEQVFKETAAEVPVFKGLSISRIGDLGVDLSKELEAEKHESHLEGY
jgi:NADH-quinone oxidoreductase subunit G